MEGGNIKLTCYEHLVSSAAVIRVVTQRFSPTKKRCVMTLITAAEETNEHPEQGNNLETRQTFYRNRPDVYITGTMGNMKRQQIQTLHCYKAI